MLTIDHDAEFWEIVNDLRDSVETSLEINYFFISASDRLAKNKLGNRLQKVEEKRAKNEGRTTRTISQK